MRHILLLMLGLFLPLAGTAQCLEKTDQILGKINQRLHSDSTKGFTVFRVNYNSEGIALTEKRELCRVRYCNDIVSISLGNTILLQYGSDSVWYVNHSSGWLVASDINSEKEFRYFGIVLNNNITENLAEYSYFLFFNLDFTELYQPMTYIGNTNLDSIEYAVFQYIPKAGFSLNSATGQYDIPIQDTIRYYFDTQSWYLFRIDRVFSGSNTTVSYLFLDNINESANDDCQRINPEDPVFAEYKLYQSCMGPYQEDYEDRLSEVPDKTLDFPLIRANGDTVYMRSCNGWKLINYWCYGCAPCLRFFEQVNAAQQQNGQLSLEKENIQLFSVNFRSNNTDTFRKYVERFHIEDYGYAANGLPGLAVPFTPYFYLIAPDGKIVYSGEAKPISEFIKAKNEYSKQHRNNKNK